MDLSNIEISFAYGEGDNATRREILRNVRTLLATPLGACPLYRDFGIDTAILDNPTPVAENLMAVEIMDAVERWEPRAPQPEPSAILKLPPPTGLACCFLFQTWVE